MSALFDTGPATEAMPDHSGMASLSSPSVGLAGVISLADLPRATPAVVVGVRITVDADHDPEDQSLALRLIEIGFVAGESVRVIAYGQPGRDPIGVRIGGRGGVTTFALRRFEAAHVLVRPRQ